MNAAQVVLTLILMQQGLAVLVWWGTARFLRVSPLACLHWAAASGLIGLALALYSLHGQVALALSHGLGNALVSATFVVMRRGTQRFVRLPYTDTEHGLVLLLAAGAIAVGHALGAGEALPILVATSTSAWCLARMARESRPPLADELGTTAANLFCGAMALLAALFALRAGAALVWPELAGRPLAIDTPFNTLLIMVFMLCGLAQQVALGLMVMMRLALRLSHLSRHDMLTGLPNRRVMHDAIAAAQQRQARDGSPFALLAVDIDHFKAVNDEHGHGLGDMALVHVAQALRDALRSDDSIARMGGEEFCALLAGCRRAEALALAERLRAWVAERPMRLPDGARLTLTVSVGVALSRPGSAPVDLLQQADSALYEAKGRGRNRVVLLG